MVADVVAFGLRIGTEVPVPGAQAASPGDEGHDLKVALAEASPPDVAKVSGPYRLSAESLFFEVPGTARFLYRHAERTLAVEPLPGASTEQTSAMLIATALPAVLWMRGDIVLHAAAAILPGAQRAIAFAGPSGSGKSTLLRWLIGEGAQVVADDTLRLDPESMRIAGLPGITMQRASLPAPGAPDERTEIAVPLEQQRTLGMLGAVVVLGGTEGGPETLHGPRALEALLRHFHRPRMPMLLDRMPTLLPRLAGMLPRLPVYCGHQYTQDLHALMKMQTIVD